MCFLGGDLKKDSLAHSREKKSVHKRWPEKGT